MSKTNELKIKLRELSKQTPAVFGVTIHFRDSRTSDFLEIIGRLDHFRYSYTLPKIDIEQSGLSTEILAEMLLKEILHNLIYAKLEKDLALLMEG